MVKARTGLESEICLPISRLVLSGLVVVMMAPRDKTERQIRGKKIEFGARMSTTEPFRIPMSERQAETESTPFQNSEKVSFRPVVASMYATLP